MITDINVLMKIHDEVINGDINIDSNLGVGYFINDDLTKKKVIPVYNHTKFGGVTSNALLVNTERIEWVSPNRESDPAKDCVISKGMNMVNATVKLKDITFIGKMNIGYYPRLSDRLNEGHTKFISLMNVEHRGMNRTIFINTSHIVTIIDSE